MPILILTALALLTLRFLYRSVRREALHDARDREPYGDWPTVPKDGSRGLLRGVHFAASNLDQRGR